MKVLLVASILLLSNYLIPCNLHGLESFLVLSSASILCSVCACRCVCMDVHVCMTQGKVSHSLVGF